MLACIVLQCGHHYISMFLTIYQPPDLTTEPASGILTLSINSFLFYTYYNLNTLLP
jgi:hypothetical protein